MNQAIVTKYIGPTDDRGARVRAKAQAGSVIIAWDYSKDVDDNHEAAARALCKRYGWYGRLVAGGMHDGSNVFVFDTGTPPIVVVRAADDARQTHQGPSS